MPHTSVIPFPPNKVQEIGLRNTSGEGSEKRILVINNCRDLGAHFNVSEEVGYGATLTERLKGATESTDKLNFFKAPYEKKEKIIRSKLIPKALFGFELAPVNEAAMRALRTAIASCLTFDTSRRAVDLTFTAATKGNDVDADIVVVCRRAAAARRAIAKDKKARNLIKEMLESYEEKGEPGIYRNKEELGRKELAGEPSFPMRGKMRRA